MEAAVGSVEAAWSAGERAGTSQTLKAHSGEEGDVAGLQGALVGTLGRAGLRLRLPSQRGVVHLAALGLEDPDVRWHAVPALHLHQIAHHKLVCIDLELVPISDHSCLLWGRGTGLRRAERVDSEVTECRGGWGGAKTELWRTYGESGRLRAGSRLGLVGRSTQTDTKSLPVPPCTCPSAH